STPAQTVARRGAGSRGTGAAARLQTTPTAARNVAHTRRAVFRAGRAAVAADVAADVAVAANAAAAAAAGGIGSISAAPPPARRPRPARPDERVRRVVRPRAAAARRGRRPRAVVGRRSDGRRGRFAPAPRGAGTIPLVDVVEVGVVD